jgi:hypothetical protein
MSPSVEYASQASSDIIRASVIAAWSKLKLYLYRRSKELSEEVRNYPTPIARCDEQLTKLIEQRAGAIHRLKLLLEAGPTPPGHDDRHWYAALDEFLMNPKAFTDDQGELAARSRLRDVLSDLRDTL